MNSLRHIWVGVAVLSWSLPVWAGANQSEMVLVPAGAYSPFFARQADKGTEVQKRPQSVPMKSFWLDRYPVTNVQYLAFVRQHPEWQKSKIKTIFADSHYLEGWANDTSWGEDGKRTQPITSVSWFAANAFCRVHGKSLPTTDQWEYALADDGRAKDSINAKILEWYGKLNSAGITPVEQSDKNGYGIHGLVGLVWEWTLDFNSVLSGAELRQTGKDKELFCGGANLNASDASDYAAFMRFSMRSSLKAPYTTPNMGFRCAKEKS